jgi:hypothetical protein
LSVSSAAARHSRTSFRKSSILHVNGLDAMSLFRNFN